MNLGMKKKLASWQGVKPQSQFSIKKNKIKYSVRDLSVDFYELWIFRSSDFLQSFQSKKYFLSWDCHNFVYFQFLKSAHSEMFPLFNYNHYSQIMLYH